MGFAQFQGRINYEITYKIDNPELDGIDKQLPYRCKFVTDGKSWKATWKSRIERTTPSFTEPRKTACTIWSR